MCHFHSRAIKDLGLASAFFRVGQVSQAKVFCGEVGLLVFMGDSFLNFDLTSAYSVSVTKALRAACYAQI